MNVSNNYNNRVLMYSMASYTDNMSHVAAGKFHADNTAPGRQNYIVPHQTDNQTANQVTADNPVTDPSMVFPVDTSISVQPYMNDEPDPNYSGVRVSDEIEKLKRSMISDETMFVNEEGVIHGSETPENNTPAENQTAVAGDGFASDMSDEISRLKNAILNGTSDDGSGPGIVIDPYGIAHSTDDTENYTPAENQTSVTGDGFASAESDEISRLKNAILNGTSGDGSGPGIVIDPYGIAHSTDDTENYTPAENQTSVTGDGFASAESDEISHLKNAILNGDSHSTYNEKDIGKKIAELKKAILNGDSICVGMDGICRTLDETNEENVVIVPPAHFAADISADNMTYTSGKGFSAPLPNVPVPPSDPDQWYNKNKTLYVHEVLNMKKHFPNAIPGFLSSNNNMYWVLSLKISKTGFTTPWTVMLVYQKDHPNNRSFGGSVKVVPINPDYDKLKKMADEAGRPIVPHIVNDSTHGVGHYLCTRDPKNIPDGKKQAATARAAAAWAADWALHFVLALQDDFVWNKFIEDDPIYKDYIIKNPKKIIC